MTASTQSDHSILEIVQSHLKDANAKMLTEDEINRIIYNNMDVEQGFTLQKYSDNRYTSGYSPTLWFFDMNSFTGQDNIAYKLYSEGGSIIGTSIPITGTQTGSTSATVLIDSTATFIIDGSAVGDTVTNSTTDETATIVTVDSETQLTTTSITSSWTNTDDYSVATTVVDSRETVTFNASIVDFGKIMWSIDGKLIDRLAHRTPTGTGDSDYDPQAAIATLRERRGEWLGVRPLSAPGMPRF